MERRLRSCLESRGLRLIDLSRALGVNKATVVRWDQKRVPAERADEIRAATGIPLHEIRPDLWQAPAEASAA